MMQIHKIRLTNPLTAIKSAKEKQYSILYIFSRGFLFKEKNVIFYMHISRFFLLNYFQPYFQIY